MASSFAGALGLMDTVVSPIIRQPRSSRNYRQESILLVRLDWGSIRQPPHTSMCLKYGGEWSVRGCGHLLI
jgi:hypothetical protein